MKSNTKNKWFDKNGWFIGKFPPDCVKDCSASGPVDDSVDFWINELNFSVPRDLSISYLKEFGAWSLESDGDTGLNDMTDRELAEKVLWLACGDISEQGEWFGLIH